jgi:carboxypeptidase PM20D1
MAGRAAKVAAGAAAGVVLLVGAIAARTAMVGSRQVQVAPAPEAVDAMGVAAKLSIAIQLRTVSHEDPAEDDALAFAALRAWMPAAFPALHGVARREVIGDGAVLLTWRGSDPGLDPLLLTAHVDVVPVAPGTESSWTHPPFSGAVADGFVWGRGALDDKVSAVGILEALDGLAAEGFAPRRTVLVALGHDEEQGGRRGAQELVGTLADRGVKPFLVMDEGLVVTVGILDGASSPVALLGLAEKGFVSLELSAEAKGGHSSMPPPITAAGRVARAVDRVQSEPFPASLSGTARQMLETVGPELALPQRAAMANLWLLSPVLERVLAGKPSTNALLRTTIAPTMLSGSPEDNVLPDQASAVINFRIIPGETVDSVEAGVIARVDDPEITVRRLNFSSDPSPVSPASGPAWEVVERAVREAIPDAIVAPGLVVGATDGRHYAQLGGPVYRFLPLRLTADDLPRIHGVNERIAVDDLAEVVGFYRRVVRGADAAE